MGMNGHITRLSDSSVFDEICINCGATDARSDERLEEPCPKPLNKGGETLEERGKERQGQREKSNVL